MRIALYTNSISAHQLPLAREIVARVGAENFRYIYTGELQGGGQEVAECESWIVQASDARCEEWLENCEVLLSGVRDVELMERRARKGLTTCYMSERWFKPAEIKVERKGGQWCFHLPGRLRLLVPGYRKMARRIVKLIAESPRFYYLAAGPWAAKDMRFIARFFGISIPDDKIIQWGYFVAPATEECSKVRKFESLKVAGEGLKVPDSRAFEPSNPQTIEPSNVKPQTSNVLRVLWVGRMLDWKRVDTIVRAVARANDVVQANSSSSSTSKAESIDQSNNRTIDQSNLQTFKPSNFQTLTLTLVGDGPEKPRLQKLASKLQTSNLKRQTSNVKPSNFQTLEPSNLISFLPPVPIGQVRNLMREHDIYVLASNAQEGWGAAVNEALEEGMVVVGTYEAGASAALLPRENLYHAGDWRALVRLLQAPEKLKRVALPREFTPDGAAERLLQLVSRVELLHSSVI